MLPEFAFRYPAFGASGLSLSQQWRRPLLNLAFGWLAVFALTFRDWAAMAHQWWSISTYNHVLFVPAIIAWLVWQRRGQLAAICPQAWWPGLVALATTLLVWLTGTLAGFDLVSQLGAAASLIAVAATVLGARATAGLAFPLGYMLFLVPVGDELIPMLQLLTAKMVIGLVHLTGMQARIEGVFIDTPAGLFEVAEACSGVMFLIAMIALATLVMKICFVSWRRRIAFLAAALVLPIVANGVRAWGTIAIAQWQGIEFAVGFDHIFYGWIFFALVVVALLAGAWPWFDRDPNDPGVDAAKINASPTLTRLAEWRIDHRAAVTGVFALLFAFGAWENVSGSVMARLPESVAAPVVPGWQQVPPAQADWAPQAGGADRVIHARYRASDGHTIDLSLAVYAAQGPDRDAAAFGEGALPSGTDWRWLEPGQSNASWAADWIYSKGIRRLAQTTYRIGGLTTGSPAKFKLVAMTDRLFLRDRPATVLILSSEGSDAPEALQEFRRALGDPAQAMDRAAGLR